MSIAFSAGTIMYGSISGNSVAEFMADFLATATLCGWSYVSITGGYKFTIASKQGLAAKVKLTDATADFSSPSVYIQFLSFDEVYEGYKHKLRTLTGYTYLLHMNECQIFIARPLDCFLDAMSGGIPFVPDYVSDLGECTDDVFNTVTKLLTTQAFWSCGQVNGSGSPNFRWSHRTDSAFNWSTLLNEDLMNAGVVTTYTGRNRLRIVPVTLSYQIPSFLGRVIQRTRYFAPSGLIGLAFDPLLVWGSPAGNDIQGRVRGQIYDAFQPSLDTLLDFEIDNLFGTNWVNYMHLDPAKGVGADEGTRFGSLMLALGSPTTSGRQDAYIY